MTEHDRTIFAKHLFVCAEVFHEPVSETRAQAYFVALADLDLPEVIAAINFAVRESRWFPRPADIRGFARGTLDERADEAWAHRTDHRDVLGDLGLGLYDLRQMSLSELLRIRHPFREAFKRRALRDERARQVENATRMLSADGSVSHALPSGLTIATRAGG